MDERSTRRRRRPQPPACALMTFLLALVLSTMPSGCHADVVNWNSWQSLPGPRTNAQAHLVSHFVVIVGGASTPIPTLVSTSQDPLPDAPPQAVYANPVILWIDFEHVFRWQPLSLTPEAARLLAPIVAKTGSQTAGESSIYISYAANEVGTSSTMFLRVNLPKPIWGIAMSVPATVDVLPNSTIPRCDASFVKMKRLMNVPPNAQNTKEEIPKEQFTFFLFGGRSSCRRSAPFVNSVEVFTVANNASAPSSWRTLQVPMPETTMLMPDGSQQPATWCGCSSTQLRAWDYASTTGAQLLLHGCSDCATGYPLHHSLLFNAQTLSFSTNVSPKDYTNPFYTPNSNGALVPHLMQFSASVYETLGPVGPHIVMYDTLFAQENHYPTITIQARRTGCAQMAVTSTIICIGGTSFPDGLKALPYVDETQILPAPIISLDQSDQIYQVGQEITAFAGSTCGSSYSMLRLATSPSCDVPIPGVKDIPCGQAATFTTVSSITLNPGDSLDAYVCYSEGSCIGTATLQPREPCPQANLTKDDCRWYPCCWDNKEQLCFAYYPSGTENAFSTFWTNALIVPVRIESPVPSPSSTPFYKNIAFIASISAVSVVALYATLTLLWRRRVREEVRTRASNQNNMFTAFGKNYRIIEQIGQGSFGHVFLAERATDRRRVALKVLPCNDPKQRDAALAEYDILYNLRHDNLIRVLDLIINWDSQEAASADSGNSPKKQRRTRRSRAQQQVNARSTSNLSEAESGLYEPLRYDELDNSVGSGSVPRRSRSDTDRSEMTDSDAHNEDAHAYGSFQQSVTFATAENVEQRDVDFISRCPRFICIVFDYFPDGDLRKFILNYGKHHQQASASASGPASLQNNRSSLGPSSSPFSRKTKNINCSPPQSIPAMTTGYGSAGSIATDVPLPEAMIWSMGQQLCTLLSYVHSRKRPVMHRDLKPENVLIDLTGMIGLDDSASERRRQLSSIGPNPSQLSHSLSGEHDRLLGTGADGSAAATDAGPRLIVTDFGLAVAQDPNDYLTTRAGTLMFAAPETLGLCASVNDTPLSLQPAADLWSVGCILYAACTKRVLPDTARVMFADVDDEDFESSMRDDLKGYSKELQNFILALLQKHPADRCTSAEGARIAAEALKKSTTRSK